MAEKRDFFFGSGSDDKGILSGDENTRPLFSGVFCPDKKFGSTSSRKRKRRLKQIKYDENVREGGYQSDSVITPKKASTKFTYACSSTDSSMGSSREDSFNRLGELEDMNMDKDSENEVKRRYKVLPVNMSSKEVFNALNKRKFRKKSNVFVCDSEKSNTGISFNKIFGLNNHVNRIKEIIFFPLMYPEIFKRLNIRPPNGLLFYGPPGTGKTMMVRSLVNACSSHLKQKVAFFSRKGGDLLDKYIGEGEKQLIELFEMANALQPSIIFFDEIDGLAPARNSKNQDQSHISLVSTLLGLMDGVTSQSSHVVVIGATNRLDNIDPALRRPGRFDYEMFFPLPNEDTRYEILKNLTVEEFASPYDLSDDFIRELAKRTEGFSGADINGLCKEAAIRGLRKSCSEIYDISKPINYSVEKMKSIIVDSQCFNEAMEKVVGSTTKYSIANPRLKELEPIYYELLSDHFHLALETINNFLHDIPGNRYPRILISGVRDNGQSEVLSACLFDLKKRDIHIEYLNIADLCFKSPDAVLTSAISQCSKHQPSVLCIQDLISLHNLTDSENSANIWILFAHAIQYFIKPGDKIIVVACSDVPFSKLPEEIQGLFSSDYIELNSLAQEKIRRLLEFRIEEFSAFVKESLNNSQVSIDKAKLLETLLSRSPKLSLGSLESLCAMFFKNIKTSLNTTNVFE